MGRHGPPDGRVSEDQPPADEHRESAAAIRYRPDDDAAPKIVAKGEGELARRIIELAEAHGIPIKNDPDLVAVLAKLDLDTEIPNELYQPIAEILAFLYRVNEKHKND